MEGSAGLRKVAMSRKEYTIEQIGALGKEIYRERIKHLVEPHEKGKFIAIDVESGDYEIADKLITASHRLRERRPESVRFGGRVGYTSAYRIGWREQTAYD